MALYAYQKVTHVRHEYILPSPVAMGEMSKAVAAASADYAAVKGAPPASDDALHIESDDESLTIYFDEDWPAFAKLKPTTAHRDDVIRDVLEFIETTIWTRPLSVVDFCQVVRDHYEISNTNTPQCSTPKEKP
jgi:hypothetical protein